MSFEIVRNDITNMAVDAIVCTANPRPIVGGGTDRAIHEKAGPELLKARQEIGDIACGHSAVTPGFGLEAKYVIHTVSPMWSGGGHGEEELLRDAYDSALSAALSRRCRSVAFPLMAAGTYGFPEDRALSVAVHAFSDFLLQHRMHIYLVVFNRSACRLSQELLGEVKSYVDENYVERRRTLDYGVGQFTRRQMLERESICMAQPSCVDSVERLRRRLDQRLQERGETFTQSLLRIIREQDLQDPEVYGRILMDRKTFNKIKNSPDHHPQRRTALQLAVALRLNLDQTRDFIAKAGYALSDSSRADLILSYCIQNHIYNIDKIDALLTELGEKALFTLS